MSSSRQVQTALRRKIRRLTVADSPYVVLPSDSRLFVDASGGPVTIQLPLAASTPERDFEIRKIDSSTNAVTVLPAGGQTIDGSASTTFNAAGAAVDVVADTVLPGFRAFYWSTPVPIDPLEFLILDRTAADFANAANLAAAQALAAAQTALFSTSGWTRFTVTTEITIIGASTALNIAARSSGKAVPLVTVPTDWSYYAVDDIDYATGISTTPSYQITVPTPAVGRYTRDLLVWGSNASAVIWVNGAGTRGNVYAQRFGS